MCFTPVSYALSNLNSAPKNNVVIIALNQYPSHTAVPELVYAHTVPKKSYKREYFVLEIQNTSMRLNVDCCELTPRWIVKVLPLQAHPAKGAQSAADSHPTGSERR